MEKITITANTYEEAVEQAMIRLRTTTDHMKIDVIEKESRGLLGIIGRRKCTIQVSVKTEDEEKEEKKKAADAAAKEKAAKAKAAAEAKAEEKKAKAKKGASRKKKK